MASNIINIKLTIKHAIAVAILITIIYIGIITTYLAAKWTYTSLVLFNTTSNIVFNAKKLYSDSFKVILLEEPVAFLILIHIIVLNAILRRVGAAINGLPSNTISPLFPLVMMMIVTSMVEYQYGDVATAAKLMAITGVVAGIDLGVIGVMILKNLGKITKTIVKIVEEEFHI